MNDRRYRRVVCNYETGTNRTSLTVSRRRTVSPCRRRRSRVRTSPPSPLIPARSSPSTAGATAPHLAGRPVGVTAARLAEILTDGSNDVLTSRSAREALRSAA
jgi:hypothetical protein